MLKDNYLYHRIQRRGKENATGYFSSPKERNLVADRYAKAKSYNKMKKKASFCYSPISHVPGPAG